MLTPEERRIRRWPVMHSVAIVGSLRTPVGLCDGQLKEYSEQKLSALVMAEVVKQAGISPGDTDEIIFGVARQTSLPSNCARHALLLAGFPDSIPAYTVQRQSASGLQAVANACWAIRTGDARIVVAGGAESMSQTPVELHEARFAFDRSSRFIFNPIPAQERYAQPIGIYGEADTNEVARRIAGRRGISDREQQEYAADSLAKARLETAGHILSIAVRKKKVTELMQYDELSSAVPLLALPADCAAAMALMSIEEARSQGCMILGEIASVHIAAANPYEPELAAQQAAAGALAKTGISPDAISRIELHEMSAAQSLATITEFSQAWGQEVAALARKTNRNGGSLATGSAWGAVGPVLLDKVLWGLRIMGGTYGLVVAPAEGGQAIAAVVKAH